MNPSAIAMACARGTLYVMISALPELISALSATSAINWPLTWAKMVLAASIALKAYLDDSPRGKRKEDADVPPADNAGESA